MTNLCLFLKKVPRQVKTVDTPLIFYENAARKVKAYLSNHVFYENTAAKGRITNEQVEDE